MQNTPLERLLLLLSLLLTAIGLSPGGSGYFTCIQNMKLVTNKFKSGELHEKHVVATWNVEKYHTLNVWCIKIALIGKNFLKDAGELVLQFVNQT